MPVDRVQSVSLSVSFHVSGTEKRSFFSGKNCTSNLSCWRILDANCDITWKRKKIVCEMALLCIPYTGDMIHMNMAYNQCWIGHRYVSCAECVLMQPAYGNGMSFNVTSATVQRMRVSINIPIKVSTRMLAIIWNTQSFDWIFPELNSPVDILGVAAPRTFYLSALTSLRRPTREFCLNIDWFKKVSIQHRLIQSSPNMMRSIWMRQITIQQSNEIGHMIDNLNRPSIAENVCCAIPITSESSQIGCLNKVRKVFCKHERYKMQSYVREYTLCEHSEHNLSRNLWIVV